MNRKAQTMIILLTMTTFINNMVHPVTLIFVKSIGYGSFFYGVLFAAMSLANFIMSPFWGKLSDGHGRKLFLIIAPIGYGVAQLGFGYSTYIPVILGFRLLAGGIACASFVVGMAYLIDVTDTQNRTKIMAVYVAITGFAATLGNLVGGAIGKTDYHITFLVQVILSILSSLLFLLFVKESRHPVLQKRQINFFKDFHKYSKTQVPFLLLITLLTSITAIGFNIAFNSYLLKILLFDSLQIGVAMAVTGVIGIIMNIVIFPFIKRRFNDYTALIISLLMIGVSLSLAILFVSRSTIATIGLLIIFFAFLALYRPLLQSILSKIGHANGEIMGLNNSFNSLGNVVGSLYAGAMFSYHLQLTFYSFAGISLLVVMLLIVYRKNTKYME